MPKERKKRGRREVEKRKRQEEDLEFATKRQKSEHSNDNEEDRNQANFMNDHDLTVPGEIPFYGLLDEDEQEYFKRAGSMLEMNQFPNDEERHLFLDSVYKEAQGKELKIANSHSCSSSLERLIKLSIPDQLKALFQTFSGHFLSLSQHRFASHCCECLFLQAAPIVTQELTASLQEKPQSGDEVFVSMENLFLYALNEFEGYLGYLITDSFASHTLRVLLLVLSGLPLSDTYTKSLYQSRKKENIGVFTQTTDTNESDMVVRTVPESFHDAINKMISSFVVGLSTAYVQDLATHPVGNPILQLLLQLELSTPGKQKAIRNNSVFRKLIPEEQDGEITGSSDFIRSLAYDIVGSRLLEVIVKFAPGKFFKVLYRAVFRDEIHIFAKNDVAVFVVIKVLDRLNQEDLSHAVHQICTQINPIIKHSRTSIIRKLIESCRIRDVETQSLSDALQAAYGPDPLQIVMIMLKLDIDITEGMAEDRKKQYQNQDSEKVHGSLLAQSMLDMPGTLRDLIANSLLAMETSILIRMAKDRSSSRVLQKSLVCTNQTLKFRRILVQRFFGHIVELAIDSIASHVVDSFWTATTGLAFIRERIATELAENEIQLRESFSGRVIWRSWKMDFYKARTKDWMFEAKVAVGDNKRGIELARERFAHKQKTSKRKGITNTRSKDGIQTGANDIAIRT